VPKRDEVTGEWRRLHSEELYSMYYSPYIIQMNKSRRRCAGHVANKGERRVEFMVLAARRLGKRPLGRPRRSWEHNIKLDLTRSGMERGLYCLAQDRDRCREFYKMQGIS
jgi:hypothetical protein